MQRPGFWYDFWVIGCGMFGAHFAIAVLEGNWLKAGIAFACGFACSIVSEVVLARRVQREARRA